MLIVAFMKWLLAHCTHKYASIAKQCDWVGWWVVIVKIIMGLCYRLKTDIRIYLPACSVAYDSQVRTSPVLAGLCYGMFT